MSAAAVPEASFGAAPPRTLLVVSTPLHSFLALGLLHGPFRDGTRLLALVDQPPQARDFVVEALEARAAPALSVARFEAVRTRAQARATLARVSALARAFAPATITVGNDHRLEFHAALRGWPSARRTYVDDGLFSYLPRPDARSRWRERLSDWRRSLKYGLPVERPSCVGGSRAVESAIVLLPQHVHAGLAGKPVRAFERAWFAHADVRAACIAAAALAGFDAGRAAGIGLLLLLPHPSFLEAQAALRERLRELALRGLRRGSGVALKGHPNAGRTPPREQLQLPEGPWVEVPTRLPVEVLAPLLTAGTLVVGSLTTALLTLVLLGNAELRVRSLGGPHRRSWDDAARLIYESVGIREIAADEWPFDER